MACREIRDPVHGFISVDDTECRIIDSRPFQRLRGIHQLALARQLYPGATHSRFEHSLGVYHIACGMCDHLGIAGDDRRRVAQAALLHDIGHGPFSHVSEQPLGRYADAAMLERVGGNAAKIHELVTCDIVTKHPEIRAIQGLLADDVSQLIAGGYGDALLKAIVSGPLDADKQDYLLRDSLMCGVRYGLFDIDQFRLCLTARDYGDGRLLAVRNDGVHAVEQFAMAKYYITTQVYRHRVRLVTDQMLARAILLGIEVDEIEQLRQLYAYDGSEQFILNYTQWDDWRVMRDFTSDTYCGTYCHALLDALRCRRLHKQVFEMPIRSFDGPVSYALTSMSDGLRTSIEEGTAALLSSETGKPVDDRQVICHAYTVKSVRTQSRDDTGGVLVDKPDGPIAFEQESTLFRSIDESEQEAWLDIFAPVTWTTESAKRRLKAAVAQPIADLVVEAVHRGNGRENAHAAP